VLVTEETDIDSHRDPTDELLTIVGIFSHFYALETTLEERQFFRALARLIGRRSARLAACGIAAIVRKKGYLEEGCEVGADGTLYNVSCYLSCFVNCLMDLP
jgi:hexokinase